ncbi:MAG TPA: carboxypeptidase-like regulatory domain-containing protein [Terriglobia bacterium]|nr:carboxypeptidase-like regulatory domain-containing protein [Terriglobia bacterium]
MLRSARFLDSDLFSAASMKACALMLAFAALWTALDSVPLMAKREKPPTSKTVVGQVFDQSDNGIPGAAVEMTNLATGKKTAIYTGPDGRFTFTDLKLNEDYEFQAHYKGQSSDIRKVSSWDTRTNLVLNLHIPPPKD